MKSLIDRHGQENGGEYADNKVFSNKVTVVNNFTLNDQKSLQPMQDNQTKIDTQRQLDLLKAQEAHKTLARILQ